jgi:tetratricopeptide (TPR) repeat protein
MQTILNNNAPVAQGIEQLPSKQWVRGSIPRGRTILFITLVALFFLFNSNYAKSQEPLELFLGGYEQEAIDLWQRQSDLGNVDATYALGIVFYDSDVTGLCKRIEDKLCKSNFKSGVKYFKIAYEAGDARAAYALGEHYDYFGKYKKAFKFYLEAAKKGVPEAQFNSASMYEHGDGVKKDTVQAVRWYLQCNVSSLCKQKEEGILDLIELLSDKEFDYAKSLVNNDQAEVNIRLSSVSSSRVEE